MTNAKAELIALLRDIESSIAIGEPHWHDIEMRIDSAITALRQGHEAPGCTYCMGSGEVKPGEKCPKCGDVLPQDQSSAGRDTAHREEGIAGCEKGDSPLEVFARAAFPELYPAPQAKEGALRFPQQKRDIRPETAGRASAQSSDAQAAEPAVAGLRVPLVPPCGAQPDYPAVAGGAPSAEAGLDVPSKEEVERLLRRIELPDMRATLMIRRLYAALERERTGYKQLFSRLAPSVEYVEGTPVGYGEDEIDRLDSQLEAAERRREELERELAHQTQGWKDCLDLLNARALPVEQELAETKADLAKAISNHSADLSVPSARARTEEAEFEVRCNGEFAASASGPRDSAWNEALHYVAQYEQDGPVEIFEIVRTPVWGQNNGASSDSGVKA